MACCLELLCGSGELDEGRQKPRALHAIVRIIGKRALELTKPDAWLAQGEPEQRQAGLRLAAGFQDAAEGNLGSAEIPATKPELAELVRRLRSLAGHVELQEVGPRGLRLFLRFRPSSVEPEDFGTMDATVPSPTARQRGARAPLLETRRPFTGATNFKEVAAGADGPAVDRPGRGRLQVAGRCRRRGLVDQRPALLDLAVANQHRALRVQSECLEVSIAEPLRHLERSPQVLSRRVGVATSVRCQPVPPGEIPMLGALGLVLEQALGALVPACRHRARPRKAVVADEGKRDARGAPPVTVCHVGAVRPFADLDAVLGRTGPGGRLADQLQILR